MVRPGSRVDLVATLQEGGADRAMAKTVVHNVLVTAVGQRMTDAPVDPRQPPEPFRSVTILVTPEQAEAVELTATTARPRLVLRNNLDKDTVESAGVSFADLRGRGPGGRDPFAAAPIKLLDPPASPRPTQTGRRTVTIIRGTTESTVTFDVPVQTDRHLLTGVERE
jgi:pilus assembly protein CpaB